MDEAEEVEGESRTEVEDKKRDWEAERGRSKVWFWEWYEGLRRLLALPITNLRILYIYTTDVDYSLYEWERERGREEILTPFVFLEN